MQTKKELRGGDKTVNIVLANQPNHAETFPRRGWQNHKYCLGIRGNYDSEGNVMANL